jgi:hypothetical protein
MIVFITKKVFTAFGDKPKKVLTKLKLSNRGRGRKDHMKAQNLMILFLHLTMTII